MGSGIIYCSSTFDLDPTVSHPGIWVNFILNTVAPQCIYPCNEKLDLIKDNKIMFALPFPLYVFLN